MFAPGAAHFSFVTPKLPTMKRFYMGALGAELIGEDRGRCEMQLHGHQLILREGGPDVEPAETRSISLAIADQPHQGLVVTREELRRLEERCRDDACPMTERVVRRRGTPFEHECFFVLDPDGRLWEVKAFGRSGAACAVELTDEEVRPTRSSLDH